MHSNKYTNYPDGGTEVELRIDQLIRDASLRARLQSSAPVVARYGNLRKKGVELPPVLVVADEAKKFLVDGFMHVESIENDGGSTVRAYVLSGDITYAAKLALSVNDVHGLRLTSADKRHKVTIALQHIPNESDQVIADLCGCTGQTVANHRRKLLIPGAQTAKRKGKDGKVYSPRLAKSKAAAASVPRASSVSSGDAELHWATPDEGEMIQITSPSAKPEIRKVESLSQSTGVELVVDVESLIEKLSMALKRIAAVVERDRSALTCMAKDSDQDWEALTAINDRYQALYKFAQTLETPVTTNEATKTA